jgi:hypothetical protein
MRFYRDAKMEHAKTQQLFGEYIESFESETRQVHADLFRAGELIYAYIRFEDGLDGSNVTDRWISYLRRRAEELGYGERLQVIYTAGRQNHALRTTAGGTLP